MAERKKKSKSKKLSSLKAHTPVTHRELQQIQGKREFLRFLLPVLCITFVVFIPVFNNGFTNWDDRMYVTDNPLLKDLSWDGIKKIFSTPVVSNYHPLTVLSLALNY